MCNVGQVSHQKSRTLSLSNGDANVTWIFGHSHHNLVSKNFDKATFLVRPTFGKGMESINSDRVNEK
ncbi:hypothetical protein O1D97_09340 [Marinomonas sp. 15G1-11]|uniref:Uncharacterized protein n=1 Tax=Marinomonas phaeophyticola TaxID=3004091 RepID=A0ABT4JUE4_9GAMM|nr:hypothetical protein [Marinomonas sp. 15G1-11]MCZ2721845.1 hypothetical protein [Marinomonas sp. 15G1-11]